MICVLFVGEWVGGVGMGGGEGWEVEGVEVLVKVEVEVYGGGKV